MFKLSMFISMFVFLAACTTPQLVSNNLSPSRRPATVFENVYLIDEINSLPPYIQYLSSTGTKDSAGQSNICFAAAAAQAFDIIRYRTEREAAGFTHFSPSSPLLLSMRYFEIRGASDGEHGGYPDNVLAQIFRLGSCSVPHPTTNFADNLITINEEVTVISELPNPDSNLTPREIAQNITRSLHDNIYDSLRSNCPANTVAALPITAMPYSVQTYYDLQLPISVNSWNAAFSEAQNSPLGKQAVVLDLCAEVFSGAATLVYPPGTTRPACMGHAVIAVGKRCEAGGTNCQILIRDSGYHTNTSVTELHGDSRNDFWISESLLQSATRRLTVITSSSSTCTGNCHVVTAGEIDKYN